MKRCRLARRPGISTKIWSATATIPEFQSDLANSHNEFGKLLGKLGRLDDAFTSLTRGQTLFEKLLKAKPTADLYLVGLGESHGFRGRILRKAGRFADAAAELRNALVYLDQIRAPDEEKLFDRAWVLALLAGLATDMKSNVTTAEASQFADKAVTALRAAVEAGWSRREELKESDFDALRQRDDFRKLVQQLEQQAVRRAIRR